jgi:hypothetical protein
MAPRAWARPTAPRPSEAFTPDGGSGLERTIFALHPRTIQQFRPRRTCGAWAFFIDPAAGGGPGEKRAATTPAQAVEE